MLLLIWQKPNVVWIESQALYFQTEVAEWEAEQLACQVAKEHLATAKQKMDEAIRVKYAKKKQSCDDLQMGSMDTECTLLRTQRASNTAYESCYQPALNTYESDKYQVKLNVRKRKLEWRTLERISCLILALVQNSGRLDAKINFCIRQLYDSHQMNLKYPLY